MMLTSIKIRLVFSPAALSNKYNLDFILFFAARRALQKLQTVFLKKIAARRALQKFKIITSEN